MPPFSYLGYDGLFIFLFLGRSRLHPRCVTQSNPDAVAKRGGKQFGNGTFTIRGQIWAGNFVLCRGRTRMGCTLDPKPQNVVWSPIKEEGGVGGFLFASLCRLSPPLNPTPAFPPPGILLQSWIVFELPKKLSFLALVREDGTGRPCGVCFGCMRTCSQQVGGFETLHPKSRPLNPEPKPLNFKHRL